MSDYLDVATIAVAAFFVVLAAMLLIRYRQVSERISASSDLGHDLWKALEDRLKKQDERVLDLMGRVEVLQARALAASQPSSFVAPRDVRPSQPVVSLRPASEPKAAARVQEALGGTEMKVVELLGDGAKSTREITKAIGLTREHTARIMKAFFDKGLVTRDDSAKPFVYQLTDKGRGYLQAG
jgi:CRP-like cAMP-binding protein